jgi:hypothetical protein
LRSLDEELTWSALDFSVEPAVNRTFRATFPSEQAANEFRDIFAEGKVPFPPDPNVAMNFTKLSTRLCFYFLKRYRKK